MMNFKFFSIILGISLCILTSASEHKETTKQKETDSKWNKKFDFLSEWMEQMEANQLTGSSVMEANSSNIFNAIEQVFQKIEKFEVNFKEIDKNIKNVIEKIDEVNNLTTSNAECKVQLEQLEAQLTLANQKALNVCSPNPCNGGQCTINATGSGYKCSNCPGSTYGNNCQKSKCDKENSCFRSNSTLYLAMESAVRWEEADRKCASEGLTMAMPKDQHSSELMWKHLKSMYGYDVVKMKVYFWLGLKNEASGQFKWTDGSPLGEYTGGSEDFKSVTGQRCGLMYFSGGNEIWYPEPCTNKNYFLCEKRLLVN